MATNPASFVRAGGRRGGLILCVAGLVTTGGVLAVAAPQRTVREQRVVVSVVDRQGLPVADETLKITDVVVREDGNAREVLRIEPASDPMHIALMADTSASVSGAVSDLRQALKGFAAAIWARSPDTQIALYSFGERPTLESDFSSSAAALSRGIDKLFPRSGSGSYFLEAVIEASTLLKKRETRRASVVAFVDEGGPEFSSGRHEHVTDALKAARASLWTVTMQRVGPNTVAMGSEEDRMRSVVLGDVTVNSGGRGVTVFVPSALQDKFKRVAAQLLAQVGIIYGRPEQLIPPERLEVRVTRDDIRVAAPRWAGR